MERIMSETIENGSRSPGGVRIGEALRPRAAELMLALPLLGLLYHSVIPPMINDWRIDENYSHGFLVPVVAGWFLWRERKRLLDAPLAPSWLGLPVIMLGLAQLVLGSVAVELFTMRSSLVTLAIGLVLYFLGSKALRIAFFPLAYLLFMVPLPATVYNSIAFPLKLLVTDVSVVILKLLNIAVLQEGNILNFPEVTLEVADACSGMRSLVSLGALGTAYAFMLPLRTVSRAALMLATVPIAMAANILRVIGTGLLSHYWSPQAAMGFFHEFAGLAVFIIAMLLIMGLGNMLRRIGG